MIELVHASSGYRGNVKLRDVSAKIPRGEITSIIGPNGCGKSTLLRMICGLNRIYGGEVLVDGRGIETYDSGELAKLVSYLPQSRNVPNIRVDSLVLHGRFPYMGYPRRYRTEDREKAREALAWVGALPLADRMVAELSGGERQKVYIAMLLAQGTEVVLMDEPTSYLDISRKFEVIRMAQKMKAEGKTVVLVLHDLELALSWSDHVMLMENGALREWGSPEQVVNSGALAQVFGVNVKKLELEQGFQYVFSPLRRL